MASTPTDAAPPARRASRRPRDRRPTARPRSDTSSRRGPSLASHQDTTRRLREHEPRQVTLRAVHLPLAREQRDRPAAHVDARQTDVLATERDQIHRRAVLARYPPRELDGHRLEPHVRVVLVLETCLDDLQLELA